MGPIGAVESTSYANVEPRNNAFPSPTVLQDLPEIPFLHVTYMYNISLHCLNLKRIVTPFETKRYLSSKSKDISRNCLEVRHRST